MKKNLLFVCLFLMSAFISFGQHLDVSDSVSVRLDRVDASLSQLNERLEALGATKMQAQSNSIYKLYPTSNVWNYLRLNTRTGQIDQVQYAIEEEDRFIEPFNPEDLSHGNQCDFELYQTPNPYFFLMIDKSDGRVWQIMWNIKKDRRYIARIW